MLIVFSTPKIINTGKMKIREIDGQFKDKKLFDSNIVFPALHINKDNNLFCSGEINIKD